MIDLSSTAKELHHHIRLNASFRSDLQWWAMFLSEWNGVCMMTQLSKARPNASIIADASGNWGCGAFCSSGKWFQIQWPDSWAPIHITVKELLPIVVACAVWGGSLKNLTIKVWCDNAAVVGIINSGRSRHSLIMHLMRCLFFFWAHHNIFLVAEHIAGKDNVAADSLSRNNLPLFRQQVARATPNPTRVPEELLQALIHNQPDWTSERWRTWFRVTLQKV